MVSARNFERMIREISDFIFLEDEPVKAEVIFIAGSPEPRLAERAAELYHAGWAPLVLVSGRYSINRESFVLGPEAAARYPDAYETEAEFLGQVMLAAGVPEKAILKEDQARFTQENAIFSSARLEAQGLVPKRAILVCKPVHARRAYTYYQIAFPETSFAVCPFKDPVFNRETWTQVPEQFARVMRELSKCGNQAADDLRKALNLAPYKQ